jgi:hypothetical protein
METFRHSRNINVSIENVVPKETVYVSNITICNPENIATMCMHYIMQKSN